MGWDWDWDWDCGEGGFCAEPEVGGLIVIDGGGGGAFDSDAAEGRK